MAADIDTKMVSSTISQSVEYDDSQYANGNYKRWAFSQWFRTQESDQEGHDLLSAVAFSDDGTFLATGDAGGRIVVLKQEQTSNRVEYKFYSEFQSHEPEFDYVRSAPIDERINDIKFLPPSNDSQYLLTTNDREVKLWKIYRNTFEDVGDWNLGRAPRRYRWRETREQVAMNKERKANILDLKLPTIEKQEGADSYIDSKLKHTFSRRVHDYNIHSLCTFNDGETFLTADNLRINEWNVNRYDTAFNLVDLKPIDLKDLREWITAIDTHPIQSNLFAYGTNKANVKLCDMRQRASCDTASRTFAEVTDSSSEQSGFFDELTRTLSDVKFACGGKFIVTRDYMSVKFWDMAMEKKPLHTIWVHEYLRPSPAMWQLYENKLLNDRFHVAVSPEGDVVTGSYNNYFHVYDGGAKNDTFIQASKPEPIGTFPCVTKITKSQLSYDSNRKKIGIFDKLMSTMNVVKKKKIKEDSINSQDVYMNFDHTMLDYDQKILGCAWHPTLPTIAIAGANNLYLYRLEVQQSRKLSL